MDDSFLIWKETYEVGHQGLDDEHRRLVEIINEIAAARAGDLDRLSNLSGAFYFACVRHFRHENSVIRNIIDGSYLLSDNRAGPLVAITEAALNDHCAEHASALIQLERMLQAHFVACDAAELASELRAWFLDHAVNHDAHLKDIFQCRHERSIGGSDRGLLGNATKLGQRSHRP